MPKPSPSMRYLNLPAIAKSLREVQKNFKEINARLDVKREDMTKTVVRNLLSAYSYLDTLVDRSDDLFAIDELEHLLELNHRVLCGTDGAIRAEYYRHILATRDKFYKNLHWLKDWYIRHKEDPVYKRAAGLYVGILCQPQLFIEGNHRTGALIASLELVRARKPPFVLSVDNALEYFNPSSVIKKSDRTKYRDLVFQIPGLKKRFGKFLEERTPEKYLLKAFRSGER